MERTRGAGFCITPKLETLGGGNHAEFRSSQRVGDIRRDFVGESLRVPVQVERREGQNRSDLCSLSGRLAI